MAVNGFGPEGRAPSEGSVRESKWTVSKKAGVGKGKGGSEGSLFHVSKQETSYARISMADRMGKLSSQRARGRHTLKGVRSPLLRPSAMYSSQIILTRMQGPMLCYRAELGGGEHPQSMQ